MVQGNAHVCIAIHELERELGFYPDLLESIPRILNLLDPEGGTTWSSSK